MTPRFLIALVAYAWLLQASWLRAQSPSPDNFMPTQPPQPPGGEANASDSKVFKYALLLPNEKSSESVKDEERNPFGKNDDEIHEVDGKSSNEETRIQEQLAKLSATGFSPGPDGLRVLFGDMWLSKNDTMPPVVKDQTLALRVTEISREAIEVIWVEKKSTGMPPRKLVIPVDLRATVRRVLHGQVAEKKENKQESLAIKRATAVEVPLLMAGNINPAEARKAAQLALAEKHAPKSKTKAALPNDSDKTVPAPSTADASSPTPAPKIVSYTDTQPAIVQTIDDPAPATSNNSAPEIAGPPAPAAENKALMIANRPDASADKTPATPAAEEPPSWKRAMGLMDNLVKLSEAKNK